MTEKYQDNKVLCNTISFLVIWLVLYLLMPTSANSDLAFVLSAVFSGLFTAFVLPLLVSAAGSVHMLVSSPIFKRRWNKFKSIKRGYYSFILVVVLFVISLFSEFLINGNAILVKYQGKYHFTLFKFISARTFGMRGYGMPNYRLLKEVYKVKNAERAERVKNGAATEEDQKYASWGDDWVLMPIYPYSPIESLLDELPTRPPHPPTWVRSLWKKSYVEESLYQLPKVLPTKEQIINEYKHPEWVDLVPQELYLQMANANMLKLKEGVKEPSTFQHLLGTDDRGRDVFARMVYGFRTSLLFALVVTVSCYIIGVSFGAMLGFYGGKFDIIMQRFVEIWSSMPFLYTVMIFATIMIPNFWLLAGILVMFQWMGMTYYIRAEFLREKSRDYVAAARAIGCTNGSLIFKHILPNALTPVISFAPFAVVGNIGSLVSLDFLGFGLPAPTPSWGELLNQGLENLTKPWLILSPTVSMFLTLLLISFIGEAIREAFDPKQYSRLR